MNFREQAQQFIEEETQFHLGDLVTEKPHPKTMNLAEILSGDTGKGVITLLDVDNDIIPVAGKTFLSGEYDQLVKSIKECIINGGTVCFSSCGASGRLAIILESMWRDFCRRKAPDFKKLENQVFSIMTGGDRALIRSVENFEDFQIFGRRQFIESGLGEGDLMIALTEGGEISSVIGSMKEALERKSKVFMLFNNPPGLLAGKFERSREMLENPAVVKLDLTTGPMALSGSTRMQATTIAMLVAGAAIEEALDDFFPGGYSGRAAFSANFQNILEQLNSDNCINTISRIIDLESACYGRGGRVTYTADRYLLDIFSDTTERAPTFMTPPFRQYDDNDNPVPWAFAKDPQRGSYEAWLNLLKREPRGIDWTKDDYKEMDVPEEMQNRAYSLDKNNILKFHIGNEDDPSRYQCPHSLLMRISLNEEISAASNEWWAYHSPEFTEKVLLKIGKDCGEAGFTHHIPLEIPQTNTFLFEHLAMKLIFNTISTGTMAKSGRVKGNYMIQLDATNKKLIDRATRVISHFAGISYEDACLELFRTINAPGTHRLRFENSYIIQTLERLGAGNQNDNE